MRSLAELAAESGDVARPFWTALAEGRLEVPLCRACNRTFFFPRRYCPHCHSPEVGWTAACGRGCVFAITVIHVAFPPIEASQAPYATGLVDLDEGVRIPARFDLNALPAVGEAVRCVFGRDGVLPVFMPLEATS